MPLLLPAQPHPQPYGSMNHQHPVPFTLPVENASGNILCTNTAIASLQNIDVGNQMRKCFWSSTGHILIQPAPTMHLFASTCPSRSPKPSCSYHCMIAMALQASLDGKLPVNEIYKYILNRFPYFRTAADNWKNSVRHCLSLGHCFHKVVRPGSYAHKKGFHWEVVSGKMDALNQEIYKYLGTTGQTAESFGIPESKLSLPNQGVPASSLNSLTSSSLKQPKLTLPLSLDSPLARGTNSLMHPSYQQPPNSPVNNVSAMLGPVGVVGLQLNQTDIEILHKLGQPHSLGQSPYDPNLLSNPSMHQELCTIVNYIKAGGSLATLLEQNSSQNQFLSTTSSPLDVQSRASSKGEHSKASHNTEDAIRIPVASSNAPIQGCPLQSGISLTPLQPLISTGGNSLSVTDKRMGSVPPLSLTEANTGVRRVSASILRSSLSLQEEIKVLETDCQPDHCHTRTQNLTCPATPKPTSNADIDYCNRSPAEFTVQYPDHIGRVEEEVLAIEEDPAYPFLCSDDENNHSMTLNQLREDCEGDWEDDEEPIRKKTTTKTRGHPRHYAFEPVAGDWNCWKESEYVEKMKKLMGSITTTVSVATPSFLQSDPDTVPVATPSFLQSDPDTDSSQCSTSTKSSESGGDEPQNVGHKHRRGKFRVQSQTKQPVKRHTRKWWAKRKDKQKKMQSSKRNSHPHTSSSTKQSTVRNIEMRNNQRRNNTTLQTNISSNEPISLTQEEDEVFTTLECKEEPSSMVVSIPFVKLLTSRQMKKYCSKLLES